MDDTGVEVTDTTGAALRMVERGGTGGRTDPDRAGRAGGAG
jgi:hypothetical protein